jgi:hypothetical protein
MPIPTVDFSKQAEKATKNLLISHAIPLYSCDMIHAIIKKNVG